MSTTSISACKRESTVSEATVDNEIYADRPVLRTQAKNSPAPSTTAWLALAPTSGRCSLWPERIQWDWAFLVSSRIRSQSSSVPSRNQHDQADNPLSAVTPKDMATFCAAPPVDIPLDLWPVLHEPHVEPRIDDGYVPVAFVPRERDGPVIRVVPHDGIWIYVRPVLSQSWGRRQTDGSFVNLGHGCEQNMHMIRHKSSFYTILLDDQNSANIDWPFFRAVELALNSPKSSQIQVEATPPYSIQLETLPLASSAAYFGSVAYPERTVLVKRSGVVGTSSDYSRLPLVFERPPL